MTFGVVYIHSGGIWNDICELSRSTLPVGTDVTVIHAEDHADSLSKRLRLAFDMPYSRTLYLDCDTVYCAKEFPEWVTGGTLPFGIAMSAWWVANHSWGWQSDWEQYVSRETIEDLPHWFRAPNAGLMLMEQHAWRMLTHWHQCWKSLGTPLIEPAYVDAFQHAPQQFEYLPGDFHMPSNRCSPRWMQPRQHYFIHAITSAGNKLNEMRRCIRFANTHNQAMLSGSGPNVAG